MDSINICIHLLTLLSSSVAVHFASFKIEFQYRFIVAIEAYLILTLANQFIDLTMASKTGDVLQSTQQEKPKMNGSPMNPEP